MSELFKNDGGLLSDIFIRADEESHRQAAELFALMSLPDAEPGEYFEGHGSSSLFLEKYGLRLEMAYRFHNRNLIDLFKREAPAFEARKTPHEQVLRPLVQLELSPDCLFEINPGLRHVGAPKEIVDKIRSDLKKDHIQFLEPKKENVGLIVTPEGEQDQPVVINRAALRKSSRHDGSDMVEEDVQSRIYGGLSEQLQGAFKTATQAAVGSVLKECARIVSLDRDDPAKILHASWSLKEALNAKHRQMAEAAQNYAQRLG